MSRSLNFLKDTNTKSTTDIKFDATTAVGAFVGGAMLSFALRATFDRASKVLGKLLGRKRAKRVDPRSTKKIERTCNELTALIRGGVVAGVTGVAAHDLAQNNSGNMYTSIALLGLATDIGLMTACEYNKSKNAIEASALPKD